jgi:hypothetical protein
MSKATRARFGTKDSEPPKDDPNEAEASAKDDAPPEASPRAFSLASTLRALAQPDNVLGEPPTLEHPGAGLEPESAVFLLAYLMARARAYPENPSAQAPKDVVDFARTLKRNNVLLWAELQTTDAVGFARALDFSGELLVAPDAITNALTELLDAMDPDLEKRKAEAAKLQGDAIRKAMRDADEVERQAQAAAGAGA